MNKGIGLPVFSGVAIGPAVVYRKAERVLPVSSGDPAVEKAKFEAALVTAREQLSALYEKAKVEIGEEQAAIVEVQMLMLDDLDYLDGVNMAIEDGAAAAIAALDTGEEFAQVFAAMDDEYMNARSADIRDMSHRLYDILCGNTGFQLPDGEFLLVAEDLAPSETIQLPRERILAFVTRQGSSSSHTAILARTLSIPSLVQSDIALETADQCTILAVDGFTGSWYADPDEETLAVLKAKQEEAADWLDVYVKG
jgi:phosphotransferase system enzyme I (PtsI)